MGPAGLRMDPTSQQGAGDRVPNDEGDHDSRACTEARESLAVDQNFVGRLSGRCEAADVNLAKPCKHLWRLALPDDRREPRNAYSAPRMRGPDPVALILHHPDTCLVRPEVLDYPPEPALDLTVYLRGMTGRQCG